MDQQTEKKSFWEEKAKPFYENRFKPFWLDNNKKNIKIAVGIVAAVILIFGIVAGVYISKRLNMIGSEMEEPTTQDVIYADGEFSPIDGMQNANSLKGLLKEWATNGGEKMSSKNVINVLLLGLDESASRSDSIIIASINKKTDQIKLISIYRDNYIYMDLGNGREKYTKITEAYTYGGADFVVKCVEDNFKIKIDHYVSVNFKTFPQVIDAVGGLDIEVKEYEAKYIRRTSRYKNFPYGKKVHLNGKEALVYSRIRYSDVNGDVSRAARQRKVIESLIKKTKKASAGQLDNMAVKLLPYVRTDMSKSEILSVGTQAIMQNWMDYPIKQLSCPDEHTGWGGKLHGVWLWVVDYPACAYNVQMAIYGQSNISGLNDPNRVTAIDLITPEERNSGSGSNHSGSSDATNSSTLPSSTFPSNPDITSVSGGENEDTTVEDNSDTTLFPRPTLPDWTLPQPPTRPSTTAAE